MLSTELLLCRIQRCQGSEQTGRGGGNHPEQSETTNQSETRSAVTAGVDLRQPINSSSGFGRGASVGGEPGEARPAVAFGQVDEGSRVDLTHGG